MVESGGDDRSSVTLEHELEDLSTFLPTSFGTSHRKQCLLLAHNGICRHHPRIAEDIGTVARLTIITLWISSTIKEIWCAFIRWHL